VSAWRYLSLLAGTCCVLLAAGVVSDRTLSGHMVQHLLLIDVAPLLLLGGAPVMLALRTLPRAGRRRLARVLVRTRPFTRPAVCLAVYTTVVVGTHIPVVYDTVVRHDVLHGAEHALYVAVGLLMWWPLHDGDPSPRRRLGGLGRLVYALAAMVPMDAVGAYLNRAPTHVYAIHYSISDQQHAGAIMWVGGSMIMVAVGLWASVSAMLAAERRQRAQEARVA
jgi:putative membrane protein